ncbi:MAG: hypothetical protein HEQ16_01590 [Bosea sp.]|nr:hypothetical protein [Bosea sp. (in: a-proteobacteria)]
MSRLKLLNTGKRPLSTFAEAAAKDRFGGANQTSKLTANSLDELTNAS